MQLNKYYDLERQESSNIRNNISESFNNFALIHIFRDALYLEEKERNRLYNLLQPMF